MQLKRQAQLKLFVGDELFELYVDDCVGGQMRGLVALDKNGQVIRPYILWNDERTEKQTKYLNETIGQSKLSQYTGNIAFAGLTAPKILWLKENEPDNFNRIAKILLPKDYLAYGLTGKYCTDYSDASGMLLLDVKNKCWSKEMCSICGITVEQLPELHESYDIIGIILPELAAELGLSNDVKVIIGVGDNAAVVIGTGTIGNGKRKTKTVEYKKIPITSMLKPYLTGVTELKFFVQNRIREKFHTVFPNKKIYDLRTTFYIRCQECGVADVARNEFVGHSLGTLGDTYTDLSDEFLLKEGQKLSYCYAA